MSSNQPTILVKKADGTFSRVPLADLKKKTAVASSTTPVVMSPKVEPTSEKKAKPATPSKLITKEKSAPIMVKEKPADFKSLLEDGDLPVSNSGTKISVTRDSDVDKVVKQLSFTVLSSFVGRLRSVVQLRLKDVRGVSETRDIVLRSIKDGGLGLTEAQADELEKKCVGQIAVFSTDDLPQRFVEPLTPAKTTPFNSFVHGKPDQRVAALVQDNFSEFKISSPLKPKPVLRDVVSKTVEMGPLEEIQFFRLIDWRRLANNPTEAANRLKQKFINLKEESILLFIAAAQAWRESPLYQEYLAMVDSAFNQHIHLEVAAGNKEKITSEEIKALINMEKELGI